MGYITDTVPNLMGVGHVPKILKKKLWIYRKVSINDILIHFISSRRISVAETIRPPVNISY